MSSSDNEDMIDLPPIINTIPTGLENQTTTENVESSETEQNETEPIKTEHELLGRGHRIRIPSTRFQDYVINTVTAIPTLTPSLPSSTPQLSSGSLFPLSDYLSYDRICPMHCSYLVALASNIEPRSFKEAMKHKVWRDYMKSEIDALER